MFGICGLALEGLTGVVVIIARVRMEEGGEDKMECDLDEAPGPSTFITRGMPVP